MRPDRPEYSIRIPRRKRIPRKKERKKERKKTGLKGEKRSHTAQRVPQTPSQRGAEHLWSTSTTGCLSLMCFLRLSLRLYVLLHCVHACDMESPRALVAHMDDVSWRVKFVVVLNVRWQRWQ